MIGSRARGRVVTPQIFTHDSERFLLVTRRLVDCDALRLMAIAFTLGVFTTLVPDVSQAGMILSSGLHQGHVSDGFDLSLGQESSPSTGPPAPAKSPKPPAHEEPKSPRMDDGSDGADNGTTSGPAPIGGSLTQAGLSTANLQSFLTGESSRIALFEEPASEALLHVELLDPPRASAA
jgi:hypothetical protein